MKILLLAGGTGGHIFPAIALAKSLEAMGAEPIFAGRPKSLEERLVKASGFPLYHLPASGFFGKGLKGKVKFFLKLGLGILISGVLIYKTDPEAIVATGSFISLAPLLVALIFKRRFFLLEQNRIPGRLTRYLSRFACETYLSLPVENRLKRVVVTGNPLRPEVLKTGRDSDGKTVLFLGGSQGAHSLNLAALKTAPKFPALNFIVLSGEQDYDLMRAEAPHNCRVTPFTTAIEVLYRRADLVVSRAGATALAEIVSLGLPSILIPFPFATDQHQLANARYLAEAGAALLLPQERIEELPYLIGDLMADKDRLSLLSENARRLAKTDGAETVARRILRCLGG